MKIENVITELEGIEEEWNGHAISEKLGGNVVKEAHYKGTATGIRIAINVLNERVSELSQNKGTGVNSSNTIPAA